MSLGGDAPEIEETELERQTARIAAEKYMMLRPELQEAEQFYIDEVRSMNDAQNYEDIADQVTVSTGAQFDEASATVTEQMAARDIDPTSGKFQGTLQGVAERGGKAGADTVNRSQTTLQDNALTGMGNLVALGEGESQDALTGMMTVANNASSKARTDASQALDDYSMQQGTLGMVGGMGYQMATGEGG